MKKNWYAVFTKLHCERKISLLLAKKRIENYCPFNKTDGYHLHRKKTNPDAIFPGFVFVYINDAEMAYIRQAIDMVRFVYWLGKPAIIKEAEIEKIKYFANEFCNIKLLKSSVNQHAVATISKEPSISMGKSYLDSNTNIKLSLPSLGYTLVAQREGSVIVNFPELKYDSQLVS